MNGQEKAKAIVEFLSSKIDGMTIKASPEAVFAPQSYDMTEPRSVIMVWLDQVTGYQQKSMMGVDGSYLAGLPILKVSRIVVSVGYRSLKELSEIDTIIEEVETNLINYDLEGCQPLRPLSISRMVIDPNKVYWRQLYFETVERLNIPKHNN